MLNNKKEKTILSIKKYFSRTIILLTTAFLILILIFSQIIIHSFKSMIVQSSREGLDYYIFNLERSLSEIEQFSLDFQNSYVVQNNIRDYLRNSEEYEGYEAMLELSNNLLSTTINRSSISSTYFIFSNNYKITLYTGGTNKPSSQVINKARNIALQSPEKSIWMVDPENSQNIIYAKVIRSTKTANSFSDYGVLVFSLNTSLLYSEKPENSFYSSELLCYINGQVFNENDITALPEVIKNILTETIDKKSAVQDMYKIKNTYIHIAYSNIEGWIFVNILNFTPLIKRIVLITANLLLLILVLLFLIMLLQFHFSKRISEPVHKISAHMKMAKDETFIRFAENEKKSRISEIRELYESYNIMTDKINYLIKEVYAKQISLAETKYRLLQKQINPHFLYNTLENIRWKAVSDDDMELAQMVLSLSNLLRASIKKEDIITLEEEVLIAQDYIAIQKIRFEDRLSFNIEDYDKLKNCLIPKFTLQPLIENAIKYNIEKNDSICHVNILFEKHENDFYILVCDDGNEFDINKIQSLLEEKTEDSEKHLGLSNIHSRLQIIFGSQYGLKAENAVEYTNLTGLCIKIKLPLAFSKISVQNVVKDLLK
ncbi:MAG: histidine kinase [Treponema sp.]|nr:histidine kinase [Treponema sp.]